MNKKIDHRRKYVICLDTETANTFKEGKQLVTENGLFYDLGWQVVDTKGNVYERRSFVNADVYLHERDLMQSAFYANKLPRYEADLRAGTRTLAKTMTIRKQMLQDIALYGVEAVCAHNARFDRVILDSTIRYVTKSAIRYFLPYGIEWWDTMKMARSVIHPMPTYRKFCEENELMTPTGRLSTTAENLYRFIIKDPTFEESHTGLEDVEIECAIMLYCFRQHKKMEKTLYKDPFVRVEQTPFQRQIMHIVRWNL